jgi:hypothetical protein
MRNSDRFGLPVIMHHAAGFCASGERARTGDPTGWIGVRQLAVQRVRRVRVVPEDAAIAGLNSNHRTSLNWLKAYFGDKEADLKQCPIRIIRDKTAFHYDKLNLSEAANNLAPHEDAIYLAQHPANALYYLGSVVVFRAIFAMIADKSADTSTLTHAERTRRGANIATEDAKHANFHMHLVLYGLIDQLLERALGRPLASLDQVRIPVHGAPDPDAMTLPTFIDIG